MYVVCTLYRVPYALHCVYTRAFMCVHVPPRPQKIEGENRSLTTAEGQEMKEHLSISQRMADVVDQQVSPARGVMQQGDEGCHWCNCHMVVSVSRGDVCVSVNACVMCHVLHLCVWSTSSWRLCPTPLMTGKR